MTDEFIDPLNDPRFPDRPTTPDFWRLSNSALRMDADAETHGFEGAIADLVDITSAAYMGEQRLGIAQMEPDPRAVAIWVDGLAIGIRFALAGGHR